MPDLETRLPDLLHRAATGAPRDPQRDRATLRRARRRRVVNASAGVVAAIALVAGSFVGVREVVRSDPGRTPLVPGPDAATPIVAIWPETTMERLTQAQADADTGDTPWRLDPVETAAAFATDLLGWDAEDVQTDLAEWTSGGGDARAVVRISNAGLEPGEGTAGPAAPRTSVVLRQLGSTGAGGVWSVVGAESYLFTVDGIVTPGLSERIGPYTGTAAARDGWSFEAWPIVDGSPDAEVVRGVTTRREFDRESGTFEVEQYVTPERMETLTSVAVLLVLYDPEGTVVAAETIPFLADPTTVDPDSPVTGPTGGGVTGATGTATGPTAPTDALPGAVLATRDAITVAAATRDLEALEALVDPDRFAYNFGEGVNPVPEWRDDPSPLDMLVTILSMPWTTNHSAYPGDIDPSSPTVYIWPSMMAADLEDLSAEERDMLDTLGITEREVRDMLEAFGGYVGPRTGIAEDGTWVFYAEGGD